MSPSDVLEAYDLAIFERRWDDAVSLLHPDALAYHVRHSWHRVLHGDEGRVGDDLDSLSDAEIAARVLHTTDLRTRYDEWIRATIERFPEHEGAILETRRREAQQEEFCPSDSVGEVIDGDTAYVVLRAWESPDGDSSALWTGLRITPNPPIVLRRHDGEWRITNDLAPFGFYVMFPPIKVEVEGATVELRPHEDEAS